MILDRLPKITLSKIGSFDQRVYKLHSFFETETSKKIKIDKRYGLNVFRHCQTRKYLKSLSKEQLNRIREIGNFA